MTLDSPDWSTAVAPGKFTLTGQGYVAVAVTGTRVPLAAASTPCTMVGLSTPQDNGGPLYVGVSTVTNDRTATGGFQLWPGAMIFLPVTDLHNVYVNGTAGDGVSIMYWT